MHERLCEKFVNKYFSNYEIIKRYRNKSLVSIEILPPIMGQKIYIWNKETVYDVPNDDSYTCELEMNLLEEILKNDGMVLDMYEMIDYFLNNNRIKLYYQDISQINYEKGLYIC